MNQNEGSGGDHFEAETKINILNNKLDLFEARAEELVNLSKAIQALASVPFSASTQEKIKAEALRAKEIGAERQQLSMDVLNLVLELATKKQLTNVLALRVAERLEAGTQGVDEVTAILESIRPLMERNAE